MGWKVHRLTMMQWSNSRGHSQFYLCVHISHILMVSDKTIHKAFRIHKNLQTKPISKKNYFHYLWKLYFGFKCNLNLLYHTFSGEVVLILSSIGKCRWISPLFQIALIVTIVSFTLPKTSSKHYFRKIANVSKTFCFIVHLIFAFVVPFVNGCKNR